MAKVSVGVSVTMRIGDPSMNEYAKLNISIDEVDTEQELEPQLKSAAATIGATHGVLSAMVTKRIHEMIGKPSG